MNERNMTMRTSVFAILLFAAGFLTAPSPLHAADPVVSNVRAAQRGGGSKLVDIWYDVAVAGGQRLTVSVAATAAGTAIPASSFSGHVGSNISPGNNRHIVWDAGADWNGQFSSTVRFSITAEASAAPSAPSGMVLIPGGSNSGTNPLAEGESHTAGWYPATYSLTVGSFYMDRYAVTKSKWDEVRAWGLNHGYTDLRVGGGKASNHPVQTVSWYDVVKWCNARSQMEGRPAVYTVNGAVYKTGAHDNVVQTSAAGYRLPTDVEWEYAARGGLSSRRFPWGDTIQHARANYYSSSSYGYDTSPTRGYHPTYNIGGTPYTSPVGSFAANGYGLYDMAGNVWEWCFTASGSGRVLRGGSWTSTPSTAGSASGATFGLTPPTTTLASGPSCPQVSEVSQARVFVRAVPRGTRGRPEGEAERTQRWRDALRGDRDNGRESGRDRARPSRYKRDEWGERTKVEGRPPCRLASRGYGAKPHRFQIPSFLNYANVFLCDPGAW